MKKSRLAQKTLAMSLVAGMLLILAACSGKEATDRAGASGYPADGQTMEDTVQMEDMKEPVGTAAVSAKGESSSPVNPENGLVDVAPPDTVRKVITDVDAGLVVENVQESVSKLRQAAEVMGGYVSSSEMHEASYGYYAYLSLRIPSNTIESFNNSLSDYGQVTRTSSSSSDVTDEYYDIQARLKNAQNQEKKLNEIMDQANSVEDLLLVREELDRVQERIEQFQGRLKMWDQLTAYSTINIELTQESKFVLPEDESTKTLSLDELWKGMKDGFNSSLSAIANFFTGLIIGLSYLFVPLLLLALFAFLIYCLVRVLIKRHAKKRAEKMKNQPPTQNLPPFNPYMQGMPPAAPMQNVEQVGAAPNEHNNKDKHQ